MTKPEWGTKRTCQSCAAHFYDLRKDPIVCPKCGATYDPEAILKSRRRAPEQIVPVKPVKEPELPDVEADVDGQVDVRALLHRLREAARDDFPHVAELDDFVRDLAGLRRSGGLRGLRRWRRRGGGLGGRGLGALEVGLDDLGDLLRRRFFTLEGHQRDGQLRQADARHLDAELGQGGRGRAQREQRQPRQDPAPGAQERRDGDNVVIKHREEDDLAGHEPPRWEPGRQWRR